MSTSIIFEDSISDEKYDAIESYIQSVVNDEKLTKDKLKQYKKTLLSFSDKDFINYVDRDGFQTQNFEATKKDLKELETDDNVLYINGFKIKRNPSNCGCYTVYYNPAGTKTVFHPHCERVHCNLLKDMYKKQKLDFETRFQWNQFKDKKMLFGKYKGKTFSELFRKHYCYLLLLTDKGLFGPIKQFVDLIKVNKFRDIL